MAHHHRGAAIKSAWCLVRMRLRQEVAVSGAVGSHGRLLMSADIEVEPGSGLDPARRCLCGHFIRDHRGNYNGSRSCDHCTCPSYPVWPEIGVQGRGSRFSLAHTTGHSPRVRLRIDTSGDIPAPNLLYGGVAMTCTNTGRHSAPSNEHHFEILNPPMGAQVITGTFAEDVHFQVRLIDDDAWGE